VADAGDPRDVTNAFTGPHSVEEELVLAGTAETREESVPKAMTAVRMRDMVGNEDQTPE
jgi:hypothetical protein